jgi:tetratricopeptide (TPR) repeat protein
MNEALFRSIITAMVLSAVLTACADPPRTAYTKSGREIKLSACKDYVSRFSDFSIRADILNKYQGELKVSAGNRATLETLQQDYVLQARQLCENAPLYISADNEQQYFCRDERLSNSLVQLRTLNSVLKGIHNIGDAKSQAESINNLVDDFMKRFFTQFDKPCSEPPKPLSPEQLKSEVTDAMRGVFEEYGFPRTPPAPNLPEKEVARELNELHKELKGLSERVEREYAEGNSYYKEGKFDTAISHFTNAIDLVPEIPSLYLALGNSYLAINRYNDAIATYKRGLKVAKPSEQVYVDLLASRASAKEGLGYYQEAIDDLSLAIMHNPNYALAYYNRGIVKGHRLNDLQGAIADSTTAIELNPHDAFAYTNRCAEKGLLNDLKGSIADCTRAIELNPDDALAYLNRGLSKGLLNDWKGAIADHTESIRLNPDGALAYLSRGVAKGRLNDLQGAIADSTTAIELNPHEALAYFNRGVAKSLLNDFQGAIADYTAAINLTPSEGAYTARGFAHKALRNEKEAKDDFNRARELHLKSSQASSKQ